MSYNSSLVSRRHASSQGEVGTHSYSRNPGKGWTFPIRWPKYIVSWSFVLRAPFQLACLFLIQFKAFNMPFFKKQEATAVDLADDIRPTHDPEKDLPGEKLDREIGHFTHDEHHVVDPVVERRVIRKLDFNVVPLVLTLCMFVTLRLFASWRLTRE